MIEIKAEIKNKHGSWEETFTVSSINTALKEIKETVKNFNNTLREKEVPREFVKLINKDPTLLHDWERINLVVLEDKGGMYNRFKCNNCGLVIKKYGYITKPTECHPERTCTLCNKEFMNEKNFNRHNKKYHAGLSRLFK